MNKFLLQWLLYNEGKWFSSPRSLIFESRAQAFQIFSINKETETVSIKLENTKYSTIDLKFWMFDRTLKHLEKLPDLYKPLGARVKPPYMKLSVEEAIWRRPLNGEGDAFLASPFICDLLYCAGLIDYGYTRNPETGNKVQGAILNTLAVEEEL
jgi:hypothetical protein